MRLNGDIIKISEEIDLYTFLEGRGYPMEHIAVERNGNVVPRSQWKMTCIFDEDSIEVVRFVGGG